MKFPFVEHLEDRLRELKPDDMEEFLCSTSTKFDPDDYADLELEYSGSGDMFNIRELRDLVYSIVPENEKNDKHTDFHLAPKIHSYLDDCGMTNQIAGNTDVWHYIGVSELKDYVTARYGVLNESAAERRRYFGGMGRNAISRLWLWAELTICNEDEDKYRITRYPFNQQMLSFALETDIAVNKGLLRTIADFVIENIQENESLTAKDDAIEEVFRRSRILNATRKLSICTPEGIVEYLSSFIAKFESD